MSLVFPPVHQLKNYISNKWPLQLVIIITCHDSDRYRNMCTFASIRAIGIYPKAYLVTMLVRVKRRTIEYVVRLLAF